MLSRMQVLDGLSRKDFDKRRDAFLTESDLSGTISIWLILFLVVAAVSEIVG